MAYSDAIDLTYYRADVSGSELDWEQYGQSKIENLPQIFWTNGSPWREANLWFFDRAKSQGLSIKTVASNAVAIAAYANWLELSDTKWWDFPQRKSERCLVKYRGSLIRARSAGQLAPSTVSARMRSVISFYRWLYFVGLLSPDGGMWVDKTIGIPIENAFGFKRTLSVKTSDLSIPNRKKISNGLEDGLLPVSDELRSKILIHSKKVASEELKLMLSLGFYTGLRLGSICDLKIETLQNAAPDYHEDGVFWLAIGPSAIPPVMTKFDVSGQVIIPRALLDELLCYAYSVRRLKRESLAVKGNKSLLFLTRYGNPYIKKDSNQSSSVNAEMYRLRTSGVRVNLPINNFKFHQTRATFATSVAQLAISVGGSINAIGLVKELLLHKNESTSLKYVRFIEKTKITAAMSNEFTSEFFGKILKDRSYGE